MDSITIRVNNGAYYPLNLYKREDVPYATAFRRDLSFEILAYRKNAIALCVNYKDGTGVVPIIREFYKDYAIALDNPIDNEIITVYPAPKTAVARGLNRTLAARRTAPPTLI